MYNGYRSLLHNILCAFIGIFCNPNIRARLERKILHRAVPFFIRIVAFKNHLPQTVIYNERIISYCTQISERSEQVIFPVIVWSERCWKKYEPAITCDFYRVF